MHCHATFYGPLVPPNTGLICIQQLTGRVKGFRMAATGNVLENDDSFHIVKKLKLTGKPGKIYKNTCFVKGMFNSDLEVSRFLGAKIRTVSGLRGEIKKAEGDNGEFRASFEDKVLLSDIIFCRTWVRVEPKRYYNPVTNLLDGSEEDWRGMKTKGQLFIENDRPIEVKKDSVYKPLTRPVRRFNVLKVPKAVEDALPYKNKQKNQKARAKGKKSYLTQRVVALSRPEKRQYTFMQSLRTVAKDKIKLRKAKDGERREQKLKEKEREFKRGEEGRKAKRKIAHRAKGKEEKRRKMNG